MQSSENNIKGSIVGLGPFVVGQAVVIAVAVGSVAGLVEVALSFVALHVVVPLIWIRWDPKYPPIGTRRHIDEGR